MKRFFVFGIALLGLTVPLNASFWSDVGNFAEKTGRNLVDPAAAAVQGVTGVLSLPVTGIMGGKALDDNLGRLKDVVDFPGNYFGNLTNMDHTAALRR